MSPSKPARICVNCGARETSRLPLVEDPTGALICRDCLHISMEFLHIMDETLKLKEQEIPSRGTGVSETSVRRKMVPAGIAAQAAPPPASKAEAEKGKPIDLKVPTPREIKEFLDLHVVGQHATKKALAVAVHNHYKRVVYEQGQPPRPSGTPPQEGNFKLPPELADVEIEKSNVLLVGPTGCGKTLMARSLARMLNVPFAIADATTLTEAGYVGEDVENILLNLLQVAEMSIERAQIGIVFVDEIDKIARKTENVSITRDVSGEGVQQALLKILEGTVARIPPTGGRKHPQQVYIELQTKNILFICGGAFVGLDKIIDQRSTDKKLGFGAASSAAKSTASRRIEPEDLMKFGLIPEFVGRLPIVSELTPLTEDDLVRVLQEPKNCMVKQYQKLLAMDEVQLEFDAEALRAIAREALTRKTGARGLRAIMEELMVDVMYDAKGVLGNGKRLRVTEAIVREQLRRSGALVEMLGNGAPRVA